MRARCPHCATSLAAHEHIGASHVQPEPGALSVCWHCGGLSVFTDVLGQLGLRLLSTEERAEVEVSTGMQEKLQAIHEAVTDHTDPYSATGAARLAVSRTPPHERT